MRWRKVKLGDVLRNREGRYKPNDPTITGLKRIDKINFSGQIFLSDKGSNTDMILVKKGDLVISGINVAKGALAVYEGEEDVLATIHYSSYIVDKKKIDVDFLKVFIRSPDFVQILKEQVPGGIKTEIKPKHILPLEVYFPEKISEQKSVAQHFFEKETKLNQLNHHISHQLALIEQLNQAILQEAVQGKLVPQDPNDEPASELLKRIKAEKAKSGKKGKTLPPIKPEEIPFDIPKNWVWCRLGEIISISSGDGLTSYQMDKSGNIPVYGGNGINGYHSKFNIDSKRIVIGRVGAYCGAVHITEDKGWVTDNAFIVSFSEANIDFNWLAFFLKAVDLNKLSYKGNQPVISGARVYPLLVPLPPLSEQKHIVAEIEKQFAKTKQLQEHILANQQATGQLLKALLHQAFNVKEMEEVVFPNK
ncbi:MAG: restriction endonuclease subunit S [Candidatus Ratteibacteria bacterium]